MMNKPPHSNQLTDQQIERQIADLLDQMTIEEKVIQLNSAFPNGNERLGIPHLSTGEAIHGIYLDEATSFPQAIGLGATWDDQLIKQMGEMIAAEGREMGVHHVFSPMLGLARDPRWGRVEEAYSEDPYLTARIGVAFVNGIQGEGEDRFGPKHMVCAPKHFVADGDSLRGSNGELVEISETTLRETHMIPFEAAVKEAKAGSLMPASHCLNRLPCHANRWLLHEVLREEWGFDGFTISDNLDIYKLHRLNEVEGHHFVASSQEAAKTALEIGVDTELAMGAPWDHERRTYGADLVQSVNEGDIPISIIDRSVKRVLKAKFLLGLFDEPGLEKIDMLQGIELPETNTAVADPWAEAVRQGKTIGFNPQPRSGWQDFVSQRSHNELALKVAQKCIVLLKNEESLLPLDASKLKKIAVIGPNAAQDIRGNYSKKARYSVSVLDGLRNLLGDDDLEISYSKGCGLMPSKTDRYTISQAVAIAQESDINIVVVGTSTETMFENHDRSIVELTGSQEDLLKSIHVTGKPVIAVLINGGAVAIPWLKTNIPAIIDGWYAGQESGTAIAQVLFGKVNPGGKLPVTFPQSTGMVPCYYNSLPASGPQKYNEGSFDVCFPFGYGLSYSTFVLGNPTLNRNNMQSDESVTLSVKITNTSIREGDQVVQLYIKRKYAASVRPLQELKGFKRITVQGGESTVVNLPVGFEQLKSWVNHQWVVEKGIYTLMVGFDSTGGNEVELEVVG